MREFIYGRNAVLEVLRAKRRVCKRLFLAAGVQETKNLSEVLKIAEKANLPIERIDRRILDKQLQGVNHQGIALETSQYPYVSLEECWEKAQGRAEPAFLLLLDHIQDPQNVATLLRTAEVVGVDGVILPRQRAAEITPAVVNASSGATEHLQIAQVANIAQTIQTLQEAGIWVVGVEDDARAKPFDEVDLNLPLALVVGAEGPGLARLTRERVDFLVRLPMQGQLASLNAAVAGSIILYTAWRQRKPLQTVIISNPSQL